LKGYRVGSAKFSEQHANFIINFGGASFEDVMSLIELAHERVLQRFGVALELEVKIL
ncbi:MAG: UDP-N-acetylmuramate dehydrogenase, partial [Campylobacter sp.]